MYLLLLKIFNLKIKEHILVNNSLVRNFTLAKAPPERAWQTLLFPPVMWVLN